MSKWTTIAGAALFGGASAQGQSLFQQPPPPEADVSQDPAAPLYGMSLFAIQPPEPREFLPNDLITIIVSESSSMKRDHKLDAKKDVSVDTMRIDWPEFFKFYALNGDADLADLANFSIDHHSDFKGDGKYERKDAIQARITARVLEVKPNGTIVVEARSTLQTDEEIQTMVLSGVCRPEDITALNTVQSSQLFDLTLVAKNEGQVKDVNTKGIFTQVIETLFNF